SVTVRFNIPGSFLDDPDFNWLVVKSTDNAGGTDSSDCETVPLSIEYPRGATAQMFEGYLSEASGQECAFDDSSLSFSGYVGGSVPAQYVTVTATTGVLAIDSIKAVTGTWLSVTSIGTSTTMYVLNSIDTDGLTAGTYSDTVYVYASGASNSPLTFSADLTLTDPPVEAPPPAVTARYGRKQ